MMKQVCLLRLKLRQLHFLIASLFLISSCAKSGSQQQNETLLLVNSFSPAQGIPGDTISITGSSFGNTTSGIAVKFNGVSSTIANITETVIKAVVPFGTTSGKISVSLGGKTATSTNEFTIVSYVSTLAGNGIPSFVDGNGINAGFSYPTDLVLDTSGNVYVADASNFRIRKITPQGLVTTLAGSGLNQFTDGSGTAASFGTILGIALDKSNNFLYVADLGNHCIRKVSLNGMVTTVAGGRLLSGYADGAANTAKFYLPMGVAVDDLNNVYVADAGNNCIRMISASGIVSTIAGSTTAGNVDGTGITARFNNPMKIKIKSSGDLVVLDQGNNIVRLVKTGGIVSTLAGTGMAGFADGGATIAQFKSPAGLCLDKLGNIYVGDQLNHRIRKISTLGVVTTIAGTGVRGYLNGATALATFDSPCGLDITASGTIYIVDNQNHRIRMIVN